MSSPFWNDCADFRRLRTPGVSSLLPGCFRNTNTQYVHTRRSNANSRSITPCSTTASFAPHRKCSQVCTRRLSGSYSTNSCLCLTAAVMHSRGLQCLQWHLAGKTRYRYLQMPTSNQVAYTATETCAHSQAAAVVGSGRSH
jgi:hypothetical protein